MTALLCGAVIAGNLAVDPLWYAGGNRLTGRNYEFNERYAKANLWLAAPGTYDCLILGSSTATFLRPSRAPDRRCFNFAFNAGIVSEQLAYARWLRDRSARPSLVIVGVDSFNFAAGVELRDETPAFVREGRTPPSRLEAYASLDAALFSALTLLGRAPYPKHYDERFEVVVDAPPGAFDPAGASLQPFTLDPSRAEDLAPLRTLFPEARLVAFVPPLSIWHVAILAERGQLPAYLEAIRRLGRHFDEVWDFSVPSAVTRDPALTYDGRHYVGAVNDRMFARLLGADDDFGVRVTDETFSAYRDAWLDAASAPLVDAR